MTETLGARIRRLRLARGLTQRELATPIFTRAFLAAVESGVRVPGDTSLRKLAERLGVDVEDLRAGRPPGLADELRDRLREARRWLSHGRVDEAAAENERVRDEALRFGLADVAGWAAYQLADVLLHRGDLHGAEAAYAAIAEDELSPDLRGAVIGRLAYARFVLGDAPRAVAMLEAELRAMRAAPAADPDAEVRVVSWLVYFCAELEWFDLGRRLEHEVAGLLTQVRNPEWVGNFYSIAAQLRHGESELDDMERMLAEADRHYRELDLERERGLCHWARGYVQRRAGRLAEAAGEFRTARAILDRVGAVQDHAGATIELAEALRRLGEPDEAAALAREAVTTMRRTRHREGVAQADRLLGVVAAGRGDDAEAERLLVAAADGYAGAGLTADEVNTCGLLGDLLHRQGRRDEAVAVYRRALHAAERLR